MGFTKKQQEYLKNATKRWNVKSGAVRSGKTYLDLLAVIPLRIRKLAKKEGLVVFLGNTKGTLERNIIEPLQTLYGSDLVSNISSNNTAMIFGQKVYCLGAEKVSQVDVLRGASIKYCYGDEVVTWNEKVFKMLQSRLDRSYSCCDLTCNPDSPFHWFYEFLQSKADIYLQTYTIDDNEYLDENFKESLKLEYANSVWYDRYILGLWVLAEGLIFSQFDEAKHLIDPDQIPICDRYYMTLDYGIMNPFACYVIGVKGEDVYVVDGYYYNGRASNHTKTDEDYYETMDKMGSPYFEKMRNNGMIMEIIHDPSATSIKAKIDEEGKYASRAGDNDVIAGIQAVGKFLNLCRLHISKDCVNMIKEFHAYSWDDKQKDAPIKEHDHACDALRYFIFTVANKNDAISFD